MSEGEKRRSGLLVLVILLIVFAGLVFYVLSDRISLLPVRGRRK